MATLPKHLPHTPPAKLVSRKLKVAGRVPVLNRSASVAQAKANLSSLLKSVETDRTEITLMRRGVPVAKIVPLTEATPVSGYGWMRGTVHEQGDIVGPTGEEWTVGNE
ncbi:type II toxin-antitoxin system Phd/YefM family antitoxin [Granulicella mallensis]|jgi:prevent-host-death family protein|uniref:Antitoxin n=1 Tax=Granulicella mallensis (strain ATCC BAA-1857 / DSM 23137 / MP5ACTX8) TaxID=682795 RepID=G8NYX5_GRAMM|nr:type II toxin-antitoxin system Phd/YefM family antitoxin [Granulicella mallensis]AEU35627.1 prevent-host-death family protein [Granulicella mallensis MP5ACTX8]